MVLSECRITTSVAYSLCFMLAALVQGLDNPAIQLAAYPVILDGNSEFPTTLKSRIHRCRYPDRNIRLTISEFQEPASETVRSCPKN
jgi:hypothetical protein